MCDTALHKNTYLGFMALPNIFTVQVADDVISRINKLTPQTSPQWGKMSVAQMLAHCCVTYEMVYEDKHPKPGAFMKIILKMLVKNKVVSETPYKRNSPTAPAFLIAGERDFNIEKARLISYIQKTQQLGEAAFAGRQSHSFGPLTLTEWNNMFYKHLDHHLTQFGC
ncbi:DUF1569 domain-containing protein [Mucilaginibacter sp. SMC90]|uniref:DUF1569 domain-containing protein n=1 Tax=Mucilaginibacter sp. SMC90 TaxID=2929803 RepID=UPI001FB46137|nr:DUF1569 domain-containing protein [Mucilaginibacter sp. SMC90]UOE50024.1 DUF1569 domain-containing protein [Mucilaginibacter sp. SMC90]